MAVPATAFDIAELLGGGGLSLNKKQKWLASCFQPDTNFDFQPRSSSKFRDAWLEKYRWLRYSPSKNGAFCINCLLFGNKNSERGQLVSSALTNFHKAASALERHVTQASHCLATSDLATFLAAASRHAGSVQTQVISGAAQIRAQNRAKLRMIVKTLLFCGRQNIPLRGHREPPTRDLDLATLPVDSNPGNFLALLHLLANSGSSDLTRLFHGAQGCTYLSRDVQNELISIIGDTIRGDIVADVHKARFFAISADEASDVANLEQLPLVVRFVDSSNTICEAFLGFLQCQDGMTGEALAQSILRYMQEIGLEAADMRCQGYDGAANMSGKHSGVAARIQQEYPRAKYVHCSLHVLNL